MKYNLFRNFAEILWHCLAPHSYCCRRSKASLYPLHPSLSKAPPTSHGYGRQWQYSRNARGRRVHRRRIFQLPSRGRAVCSRSYSLCLLPHAHHTTLSDITKQAHTQVNISVPNTNPSPPPPFIFEICEFYCTTYIGFYVCATVNK